MRQLTIGILAHVDAGKTTLSEAILYRTGCIKRLGRVDHQDAFLDTDAQERERGITIFSKQAVFPLGETQVTLLDTPGHVDFSAETERTLQVLDCAILVISGADGVQGHTETLWRLLERHEIPVFLFCNKMDQPGSDREALLDQLRRRLGENCVDFTQPLGEEAAMATETLLEQYLETGTLSRESVREAVARRKLFPCYFGSALKLEGVDDLLEGLEAYAPRPEYGPDFGARVFKISRDSAGTRLTWMKITGGALKAKTQLTGTRGGKPWTEKADQLRRYSGAKFQPLDQAEAGSICAVTGLTQTRPGQGLGFEDSAAAPDLIPVLTYQVLLPEGVEAHTALQALRQLEEEDPQLQVLWNEALRELHVQLMGPVQVEVLTRRLADQFGLKLSFGQGSIVYRETIAAPVVGVGHFEPLRHYAEVHLLLEPGERGSGLVLDSRCSLDQLDVNWQRLILTHLGEKPHLGVLTGSPITDVKITLLTGRAHLKHTEGGDFRQATYRAVRQALFQAESILLEPWYQVRLELPAAHVGRAMSDLQQRSGSFDPPELEGDRAVLVGTAPVATLTDYGTEVLTYTKGRGRLSLRVKGYFPCHNPEEVIAAVGYDRDGDVENTPDSVFCGHGAGFVVKWDQVSQYQHLETPWQPPQEQTQEEPRPPVQSAAAPLSAAQDKELQAIFERTYGPVKQRRAFDSPRKEAVLADKVTIRDRAPVEKYLLVDGYNIIFSWTDLHDLAQNSMDRARDALINELCSYQSYTGQHVILVFDAYRVKGGTRRVEKVHNIHVVYTQEAETADQYIEQASYTLGKHYQVRVASSDNLEQIIVLGHGCIRVSAKSFREEVELVKQQVGRRMAGQR